MAKKKVATKPRVPGKVHGNYKPERWWCCEGCGEHHRGKNPPDKCRLCGHQYFDNWADMIREGRQPEYDRPFRDPLHLS